MIDDSWKRIGGIHVSDDGTTAAVWIAHDPAADVIHLYDTCVFKVEVLAVVAEGLNARGRKFFVAWNNKEMADQLLSKGCNMSPDPVDDSDSMAEMISRDIWERMRTGRFKVERRLQDWQAEFKSFNRDGNKVPRDSHPLMAATRHAISQLAFARSNSSAASKINYPKVATI